MIINVIQCCKSSLNRSARVTKYLLQKRFCTMMKTSSRMETMLKKADRVPESYELVYRNKKTTMHFLMYHGACFMAFASLSALSYIYYKRHIGEPIGEEVNEDAYNPYTNGILVAVNLIFVVGAVTLRTRMPIRMYRAADKKTHRAIYHGAVPYTVQFYEFPGQSLSWVSKLSWIPIRNAMFAIEGHKRRVILFEEMFRSFDDFYILLKPGQLEARKDFL